MFWDCSLLSENMDVINNVNITVIIYFILLWIIILNKILTKYFINILVVSFYICRLLAATRCTRAGFVTTSKRRTQWIGKRSRNWYAFSVTLVNPFKLLVRIATVVSANTHASSVICLMTRIRISTTATAAVYAESAAATDSFTAPSATCACRFSYETGIR